MKAKKVVFSGVHECSFEEFEIGSVVADDHVLIRTLYSLISPGTELAMFTGTHINFPNPNDHYAKYPFYPGYAAVGRIVSAGKAVHGLHEGDIVCVPSGHAEYSTVSSLYATKLPDDFPAQRAVFWAMAEISMTAVIQSRVKAGANVVVMGMGLIGNLAAQLYALQGVRPIGVDLVERRLRIAEQSRIADTVLSGPHVDLPAAVKQITGGPEPDIVVEATGNPAVIQTALELVRPRGQVILLGSPRGKAEINVYEYIHRKGVSLIGAHAVIQGTDGLPSSSEIKRYVSGLIEKGILCVDPLHTHTLPAAMAKEGYELLLREKDSAIGVILDWT